MAKFCLFSFQMTAEHSGTVINMFKKSVVAVVVRIEVVEWEYTHSLRFELLGC